MPGLQIPREGVLSKVTFVEADKGQVRDGYAAPGGQDTEVSKVMWSLWPRAPWSAHRVSAATTVCTAEDVTHLSSHSALAAWKHIGHRPLKAQWAKAPTCPEAVVTFTSPAGRRTGLGRSPEAGSEVAATFGSENAGWAPGLH